MKRRSTNVSAALSSDELDVLAKFATNTVVELTAPAERVNTARTTQALVRRGRHGMGHAYPVACHDCSVREQKVATTTG